ncbi:hypothetical protein TNIN_166271 [Trichonephila inaurata madagascariensis]|uniref:Uncharacterized protein n=1 Tax=Trichonephila inaurata madagascariensis TaxID=2747483 RepID=A0A8X6Y3Z4_9ARAC|nr:hypothetical protein TNIN_166271 [Trichonephila inaurata madagascariensis]
MRLERTSEELPLFYKEGISAHLGIDHFFARPLITCQRMRSTPQRSFGEIRRWVNLQTATSSGVKMDCWKPEYNGNWGNHRRGG